MLISTQRPAHGCLFIIVQTWKQPRCPSVGMDKSVVDPDDEILSNPKKKGGLPWWLSGEKFACQCRRRGFDSWVGKIPQRRKQQSTPVFLPGKSHGQRSLAGYSPPGRKSRTRLSD